MHEKRPQKASGTGQQRRYALGDRFYPHDWAKDGIYCGKDQRGVRLAKWRGVVGESRRRFAPGNCPVKIGMLSDTFPNPVRIKSESVPGLIGMRTSQPRSRQARGVVASRLREQVRLCTQ